MVHLPENDRPSNICGQHRDVNRKNDVIGMLMLRECHRQGPFCCTNIRGVKPPWPVLKEDISNGRNMRTFLLGVDKMQVQR